MNEETPNQELPNEEDTIMLEEEDNSSIPEQIVRAILLAYSQQFNKVNDKNEILYTITITTHKVPTPDGNKDVAYLRLQRGIRPKYVGDGDPPAWEDRLIHQEIYVFKNLQERLNPKSRWKEQLFINMLTRLTGAGLEYAELLQKLKQVEEAKKTSGATDMEDRLTKIGLVSATEVPKPLTEDDEKYKQWLAKEREKEELK